MWLRDATDADIWNVVSQMRGADAFEVFSGRFSENRFEFALDLVATRPLAQRLLAFGAESETAIALLGLYPVAPARAEVLMVATDAFPKIGSGLTKWLKREGMPRYLSVVNSAECRAWEGNTTACKWLEHLGFTAAAILPEHDDRGSLFLLYRWINPRPVRKLIEPPG